MSQFAFAPYFQNKTLTSQFVLKITCVGRRYAYTKD